LRRMRKLWEKIKKIYYKKSLQFILSISFTLVSVTVMLIVTLGFSKRFTDSTEKLVMENNRIVLEQVNMNLDEYLHNMMSISNVVYYNIIKGSDIGQAQKDIRDKMKLIYDANLTYLVSMSILSDEGEIIAAQPFSRMKSSAAPKKEEWFIKAGQEIENVHFSAPHVENLFVNSDNIYHWVITLSRSVELIRDGRAERGVLLVDMNFTGIEKSCKDVDLGESGYIYIVDGNGEIIYHPDLQLIYGNIIKENNVTAAGYSDGSHMEMFEGEERAVTVKTMGYTGWKIVGVSPKSDITNLYKDSSYSFWLIALSASVFLILVNLFLSSRVTNPIKQLEKSVRELEKHNMEGCISVNGTYEIRHLGKTLQSMAENMRKLMRDIVAEQEGKRKSEMDVLQSQINPHFLYNALDSIIAMIDSKRYEGAVTMITALAQLFRISLSKGRNIIPVEAEIEHVRNYLIIQKMRYKNKFEFEICMDEDVARYSTIKLIVQPLVENAIYHGMEYMYGDGEICVRAYKRDEKLFMEVEDNGPGMTREQTENLLNGTLKSSRRKGSGIGFSNVQERIKLYYGEDYGITLESEPDEGTIVRICLPLVSIDQGEQGEFG
jgi:two-component system sensor histidine kinase YesM